MALTKAQARILLVEDFEDSRRVLRQLLEIEGFQVLEAEDGEQGIETARRETLDLILMDLSLPTLDGLQAAREIRALGGGYQTTPIIIISAYDTQETHTEALAAGCTDYITKPIDFDHLMRLIRKYIATSGRPGGQAAVSE
jgi:CheY-like chemotaxis protein